MSNKTILFCGLTATHPEDRSHYRSLCFAYLSAYAKQRAPFAEVRVADAAREVAAMRPDLVGISATSTNIKQATALARQIKNELGVPLILGGIHVTALPHTLPEQFDIGMRGEGEETFVDLLRLWRETGRLAPSDLPRIPGLVWREDGRVAQSDARAPLADLSALPLPDRSILGGDWTHAHMVTSRGCPFDCRFCASKRFWGGYRASTPEQVLAEVDDLVHRLGAREVHFFDDLFVADLRRLTAIADGLVARGYPGRVEFSCAVRAELAKEEMFEQLARLKMRRITFGAESASPRVLRWLKGEGASVEANQRTLDLARRFGMTCSPSFIKGAPGETGDDLLATYEFILRGVRERKIDYFEVHCLTPFPGTAIWDLAQERGLVRDDMDFDELRVPWESLYLNDAMPKTSFYFFENLTELGTRWLGLIKRRVIGIIDVSHGMERLDELLADLRARGILDAWRIIAFRGDGDLTALGADAGGPELLRPFLDEPDDAALFVYMRPEEGVDADAVNRIVWWHFDSGDDLTLHNGFRHFAPASRFERTLAAGNIRALRDGLEVFDGRPDALDRLRARGLRVGVYRPEEDPFAPQTPTARLFVEKLRADFGIDRPWRGRQRLIEAVEERIITDAARLPEREKRERAKKRLRDALRRRARRLFGRDE